MDKKGKGKRIDDDEKREIREQKADRAQNYVKSVVRENVIEASSCFKQQM